ncbi:MAG: flavodoxin family protein [Candidatus Sulfobium sp.]|jgi:multimeric flavodoxin WrbA
MKLISLLGSPHGLKGNTAGLLHLVLEGAEAEGASAETIVLKGDTVFPCRACDACHKKGRCVQKDDFEVIKKKVLTADGLVLASPNYIFNVSAQIKAFMDRCCGVIHCMQFWGKYGASVVTSGGGDEQTVAGYMSHFLVTTGAVPVGAVWAMMSAMPEEGFTDEVGESAVALGKRLVTAWRAGEVPAEVHEQRNAFRRRMHALVDWRKEEWPFEYSYWKENMGL